MSLLDDEVAQPNVAQTGTIGSGWASTPYRCHNMVSGSLQLNVEAGAAGDFYIEVSNTGDDDEWYTVDDSTLAADDTGLFWNLGNLNSRYVRVGYSGSSIKTFSLTPILKQDNTVQLVNK
jgi:hypothetical protein